jgi:hypothetical protein
MTEIFERFNILTVLTKLMLILAFVITIASVVSISANAQTAQCQGDFAKIEVKWWSIGDPGNFLPIIPASCTLNENGTPQALPLTFIPTLFIRAYGLIVSFAFYLITPVLIGSGLMYMYGGIDQGQVAGAKKWLTNSAIGFFMIISFYFIIFLILGFLDPEGAVTGADLSSFIV